MRTKVFDIYAPDRFIILRIFRWILLVLGLLIIVLNVKGLAIPQTEESMFFVMLFFIRLGAIVTGILMTVSGELIKLLIDTEENGRLTNQYLRYICEDLEERHAARQQPPTP